LEGHAPGRLRPSLDGDGAHSPEADTPPTALYDAAARPIHGQLLGTCTIICTTIRRPQRARFAVP